jgi:hypothetical protein
LKAAMMAKSPTYQVLDQNRSNKSPKQQTDEILKKGAILDYMPWSKKGAQKKLSLFDQDMEIVFHFNLKEHLQFFKVL